MTTEVRPDPATAGVLERLAAVRGEGTAAGGKVRVVLDGTCDLVDLALEPAVLRSSVQELSAAIREAFAQARRTVREQLDTGRPSPVAGDVPLRTLEEIALSAHRRLAEMSAFAEDLGARTRREAGGR
jgi:DNA-binding protein YbaB